MGARRWAAVVGALGLLALGGRGFGQELSDAEMVAVPYVQKARPSPELVGRIETMLAKARAKVPRLGSVRPRLPWPAGQINLEFSAGKLPQVGDGTNTGIPELDKVLAQFGVVALEAVPRPPERRYLARLDPLVNIDEVASTFEQVPYVNWAGTQRAMGEAGDSISLDTDGDGYVLTFSLGWGDCEAGCTEGHRWRFRFSPDLELEGVEEEGDPLEQEDKAVPLGEALPGRRPPRGGVETRN